LWSGRSGDVTMILQAAIEITCHDHSTTAWVGRSYILLWYLVFVFVVRFLFIRWFPCIRHSIIFWWFPYVMVRVPLHALCDVTMWRHIHLANQRFGDVCWRKGCGVGIQISRSSSGHLNILVATSRSFWLWLQNNLVQKIRKKHCIICITRLPHKLFLCKRNPNFRLQLHYPKAFGSGSSYLKLLGLRGPAPQPWLTQHAYSGTSAKRQGSRETVESNGNLWKTKKSLPICLCSSTTLTSKIITEIIENHSEFLSTGIAAINLFQVGLDKPWIYLLYDTVMKSSGVGGGDAGVKSEHQNVLICWKSGQNPWQMAPNVAWLRKMAPQVCRENTWRPFREVEP